MAKRKKSKSVRRPASIAVRQAPASDNKDLINMGIWAGLAIIFIVAVVIYFLR